MTTTRHFSSAAATKGKARRTSFSVAAAIRAAVDAIAVGEPFSTSGFRGLGTRAAIDQAMSRMTAEGTTLRLVRGVYVRPAKSRFFPSGQIPPVDQIVRAMAQARGEVLEIHGAEAERRFGLTTLVMMKPVYLTSGRSRVVRLGKLEIEFRHACPRRLAMAGTRPGQALLALLSRGRHGVGPREIGLVRARLSPGDFDVLRSSYQVLPAWLSSALRRYGSDPEATRPCA